MKRFALTFSLLIISSLILAQVEDDPSFTEYQDKVPGTLMVEFGWAYDSEYPSGMELDWWRSRTFNLYYMYDIRLGSEKLSLNPGFGLGTDNYSFQNNIFVVKGEDSLSGQVVNMDASTLFTDKNGNAPEVKSSKINPIYLDIPIEIRFRTNSSKKSFRFAFGGKVGIRVDSKSKIKYKSEGITNKVKVKNDLHIEQFRYGIYFRVGYGSINFWVYKALSNLFVDPSTEFIKGNYNPWVYGVTLVTF